MINGVECRECIITNTVRGKGVENSPFRRITEVWIRNDDGTCRKIAEYDPCKEDLSHSES